MRITETEKLEAKTTIYQFLLDNGFSENKGEEPKPYTFRIINHGDVIIIDATKDNEYYDGLFFAQIKEICFGDSYYIQAPKEKETLRYKGFTEEELLKDLTEILSEK